MTYAKGTKVSVEKSRSEIERTLGRYGADGFGYFHDGDRAAIQFRCFGRKVRFVVQLPDKSERRFTHTPAGRRERHSEDAFKAWEAACRELWRALSLMVKAKLEAVESGIVEFDDEFMAHILMPDGKTVGDHVRGQISASYETGEMPRALFPKMLTSSGSDDIVDAEVHQP